ncbi:uncharacterized protein CTRU02_206441 [Colletotrichum truncatum]|uniref:Uncharacterized protein n=1 Tax=Colletotrichum truncatum TaxID=5467 RepID=A0ACC3Z6W6_COLTU
MNNSTGPPASMTTAISTLVVRNTQDGTPRNLKNDLVTTLPTHLNGPSLWDIEAIAKSSARQSNSSIQRQLGALDAHIERRQHAQGDPARIRQINQELEEQVESETTKNTPNDSETPRDVARQHAQLEVAFEVASVNDTSSGEDSDEEIQWYHCYQDQRRVHYIKKDEAWKKQQENDEQGTDEQSKN